MGIRQGALENLVNRDFWRGRRVFVTGHTGFKGSWLATWLAGAGARVTGYALPPDSQPNLYEALAVSDGIVSIPGDVRDRVALKEALAASEAEIVLHLAAQSLVRESYGRPVETYATNVMGTVHLLECVRTVKAVRAVVVVTSDKCYANQELGRPFREDDPLGGHDPYSSSKAAQELVAASYRKAFDLPVATARAGNVIGGGDWGTDRLVPDLIRSFVRGETATVRNPAAIRPWQHVLEPLEGYLQLAERLYDDSQFAHAWNFGPSNEDARPVRWIADALAQRWGRGASWQSDAAGAHVHEAMTLTLDSSQARAELQWKPKLSVEEALHWVVEWEQHDDSRAMTRIQIERYERLPA